LPDRSKRDIHGAYDDILSSSRSQATLPLQTAIMWFS
jgi:hypothetical protein